MLCDICHKNIATIHLTELDDEDVAELHLCQFCSQSKAKEGKEPGLFDNLIFNEKKTGFSALECAFCGLKYRDFRQKGLLGCEKCYEEFDGRLLSLLKKLHGSTRHTGKFPDGFTGKKTVSDSIEVQELKQRLDRAVELEEYEEAAGLRDRISDLEKRKDG